MRSGSVRCWMRRYLRPGRQPQKCRSGYDPIADVPASHQDEAMKLKIEPSRWQRLWTWVDRDFDHVRPLSLAPLAVIPSIPLGIAFAANVTQTTVEIAKWVLPLRVQPLSSRITSTGSA